MDDARGGRKAQGLDSCAALFVERFVEFDSGGVGLVLARGHDDDTAVARAEVVHLLPGLKPAQLEHLIDDGLGCGEIRREFFAGLVLGAQRKGQQGRKEESQGSVLQGSIYTMSGHLPSTT